MNESRPENRRGFIKKVVIGLGAATFGWHTPGRTRAQGRAELILNLKDKKNKSLNTVGGTLILDRNKLDNKGLLLYRANESEIRVFSRRCTHRGCQVSGFLDGVAKCPCHGAEFDLNGQAISGPAKKSLKSYEAILEGERIFIS